MHFSSQIHLLFIREMYTQSAVDALNAGVDLILISYDDEKVYDVLYALIQAQKRQVLSAQTLHESQQRLKKALEEIGGHKINCTL